MGSVCVRRVNVVSVVHSVAILSVVFCVICSLFMFVYDASGFHVSGMMLLFSDVLYML